MLLPVLACLSIFLQERDFPVGQPWPDVPPWFGLSFDSLGCFQPLYHLAHLYSPLAVFTKTIWILHFCSSWPVLWHTPIFLQSGDCILQFRLVGLFRPPQLHPEPQLFHNYCMSGCSFVSKCFIQPHFKNSPCSGSLWTPALCRWQSIRFWPFARDISPIDGESTCLVKRSKQWKTSYVCNKSSCLKIGCQCAL